MTQGVRIAEVLEGKVPEGDSATVYGWVRPCPDSKARLPLPACPRRLGIRPASGRLEHHGQPRSRDPARDRRLRRDSHGQAAESPGKGQSVELQAVSVDVIGWVDDPDIYPISPKRNAFEYLRELPHLRVRTNTIGAVTRVRNTPIVTTSDAEGGGELFRVSTLDLAKLPQASDGAVDFSPGGAEF